MPDRFSHYKVDSLRSGVPAAAVAGTVSSCNNSIGQSVNHSPKAFEPDGKVGAGWYTVSAFAAEPTDDTVMNGVVLRMKP